MKNRTPRLAVCSALGFAVVALSGSGAALAGGTGEPAEAAPPAKGDAATAPAAAAGATPAGGNAAATPAPAAAAVAARISATEATLHQGTISIDGDLLLGISSGSATNQKPFQIVPNLYYGVSNELTAGFANNTNADIFQAASVPGGRGLCLNGTSNGCAHVYNGFSLDALFSFMRSSRGDLAVHGGVDFVLDPFLLSLRLGVKGKAGLGPLAIVADPSLNIGLHRRDQNKDHLQLPVRIGIMVAHRLNVGVSVALNGQLDGFGDKYTIPLGAGAIFALNSAVDVRAQFAFDNLAGKNGSSDLRTVSVGAAFHM